MELRVIVNEDYYEPRSVAAPDTRMVVCVLRGYRDCAALCVEACICSQMPREDYERAYEAKYGRDEQ